MFYNMSDNHNSNSTPKAAGLGLMFPAEKKAPSIGNAIAMTGHMSLAMSSPHIASAATIQVAKMARPTTKDLSLIVLGLKLLSAIGDGLPGHSWIKASAGIALEILDVIDVSQLSFNSGSKTNFIY